eukprot:457363_1
MPSFVLHFFTLSILTVSSQPNCRYAQKGSTYRPTDVCFSYPDNGVAFTFHCDDQEIFQLEYTSSLNCSGSPTKIYNQTSANIYSANCNATTICDYVAYTKFETTENTINCSALPSASYSENSVINECLYAPSYGSFYMKTCTQSQMSTRWYTDSNCTGYPIETSNTLNECDPNKHYYYHTTECTRPMNQINDNCGYVQLYKHSDIMPLNYCSV